MRVQDFKNYTLVELSDGTVRARHLNLAVPGCILLDIMGLMKSGVPFVEIIDRLRLKTVPPGYTPHPWTPGIIVDHVQILLVYFIYNR